MRLERVSYHADSESTWTVEDFQQHIEDEHLAAIAETCALAPWMLAAAASASQLSPPTPTSIRQRNGSAETEKDSISKILHRDGGRCTGGFAVCSEATLMTHVSWLRSIGR